MVEEGDKQVSTNVLELARKLNIDPALRLPVHRLMPHTTFAPISARKINVRSAQLL